MGWIFNRDTPPEFVWIDPDDFSYLPKPPEEIHWFDAEGKELEKFPENAPDGRLIAVIRSRDPDNKIIERGITVFLRPKGWWLFFPQQIGLELKPSADQDTPPYAHQDESKKILDRFFIETLNGSTEAGAELVASWHESSKPEGEKIFPYGPAERASQTKLKARLATLGKLNHTQPLPPPREFKGNPAPTLTPASPAPDPSRILELNNICAQWVKESNAPFVTLAIHKGRILHHASISPDGKAPLPLDFRSDLASLSKTLMGLLAARFSDAGLIDLDAPVSTLLPGFSEYPQNTPTFMQCLRHDSGLTGHGSWGGVSNPWFDHIVLNGIETLHPGKIIKYNGDGFDLVGSAMQLQTGHTVTRTFHEGYLQPLGFPPTPITQMGTGIQLNALELATFGQIILNRGRYGDLEFFSEKTYEKILPTPYAQIENPDPNRKQDFYGLGVRWIREYKKTDGELILSPRTLGHGSFFGNVLLIDLENEIIITQIRTENHKSTDTWLPRYIQAVKSLTE